MLETIPAVAPQKKNNAPCYIRNRTGLFVCSTEPVNTTTKYSIPPLAARQKTLNNGYQHEHVDVNNYFRKKTLEEILKLHNKRTGFLGSSGIQNYRLQLIKNSQQETDDTGKRRNFRSKTCSMIVAQAEPLNIQRRHRTSFDTDNTQWQTSLLRRAKTVPSLVSSYPTNQNKHLIRLRKTTLASQLISQRDQLVGVDACIEQNKTYNKIPTLATLLPQTSDSSSGLQAATSPRRITQSPSVAVIDYSNLPHSANVKKSSEARAFVPGTHTYRHFGLLCKVNELHQMKIKTDIALMTDTRKDDATASKLQDSERNETSHINYIFHNPSLKTEVKEGPNSPDSDSEDLAAPPNSSQLRNRTKSKGTSLESQHSEEVEDTVMDIAKPNVQPRVSTARRMSNIDMVVHNEDGEAEEVQIDVADQEEDGITPLSKTGTSCKQQSIADRIRRRRNSEVAADILRMSAAHRRREFVELIDEHNSIVRELEKQYRTQQCSAIQPIREDKENSTPLVAASKRAP